MSKLVVSTAKKSASFAEQNSVSSPIGLRVELAETTAATMLSLISDIIGFLSEVALSPLSAFLPEKTNCAHKILMPAILSNRVIYLN